MKSSLRKQSISTAIVWRLGALLVALGGLFAFTSWYLLAQSFDAAEGAGYRENALRVGTLLEHDQETLATTLVDYAKWDDALRFVEGRNPGFIVDNFTPSSLVNLQIDAVVIMGAGSHRLASLKLNADKSLSPLTEAELTLYEDSIGRANKGPITKSLQLGGHPALLAETEVTDTAQTRSSSARISFLRYLDGPYQAGIQALTGVDFELIPAGPEVPRGAQVFRTAGRWQALLPLQHSTLQVSMKG
ncbi:MAG: CHASE4 domain-containing protein, partial [Spirochaetota bacterium]